MGDGRDDEMIEIGDPAIEPTAPEPAHQVVIQYRDRGVPWMLLPALLMLSAIGTIYAYRKLQPPPLRPSPTVAVAVADPVAAPTGEPEDPLLPPDPRLPRPEPEVSKPAPVEANEPPPQPAAPASPDVPASADPPAPKEEPRPAPRVQSLGFDPEAFQPDPRATDSAVSPASQDPAGVKPAPAQVVDPSTLPVEVDPDDLPPDPRKAKESRARRSVEAKKRVESERVKFHEELRVILRQPGKEAGVAILELCQQYGTDVDPASKDKAVKFLAGPYAGASQPVRINLLRAVGFPETAILDDLYKQVTHYETPKSRSGWKSDQDVWVHVATILVNNPPSRPPTATPPAAAPKPKPAAGSRPPGSMLLRDNPGR